jgi:transcriptional regulator with XRE-family HTH domain
MMEVPFVNTVATGRNIDMLRTQAGLSVRDMQMVFGFATPQAIYKWIHGTAMPTIDNMVILAAMFDVTVDEIIAVDMIDVKCG